MPAPLAYAELHCLSCFSFLRGASDPAELVQRAHELGYRALALTDECSLAGVVRAHTAARQLGLRLIIGSELLLQDGLKLVLLARNRRGYGQLSALITRGRRRSPKGRYELHRHDLETGLDDCLALLIPAPQPDPAAARWLAQTFPGRAWLAAQWFADRDAVPWFAQLRQLARDSGLPLVACGDVHMHSRRRKPLQDTLTAIRLGTPVQQAGHRLFPNGERHLRPLPRLREIFPADLLQETLVIADQCDFSLDSLRYEYPEELVPAGLTASEHLHRLTEEGMRRRWPDGTPAKVQRLVDHELALIAELAYEPYFLTVHDIVSYARSRDILCQGRGSAANSAVCYCLGITEVDPERMNTLFERFISRERQEPPDIDVDFEHQRREEVIQYIYAKYGRHRAALTATVITYRPRSAIRDVGKALGFGEQQVSQLCSSLAWWDGRQVLPERLRECGLDPEDPLLQRLLQLVQEILGFPRHLSQHTGGLVISRGPLSELVPLENAAMAERTVIQWDKDDLDSLGLLKVDCLALGMLTAIHKTLDLLSAQRGEPFTMADIPADDTPTWDMISRADTIGVFQIESRAQMSMLPRLRPRSFYDLVIEVAIIRPGPIQGGMIHPYLRRRQGREEIRYPDARIEAVLQRTLGVPIFQEQVMELAMVAAGFSAGEADQLRRSMAAWRRKGGLEVFEQRLVDGMKQRGYDEEFARRLYQQILGFGEYGFPESHAASFALLAWVSAWLKCHEPAAFTCALLNSQPMGFYGAAQLIGDARRHGVEVRAVDVRHSNWDCSLEPGADNAPALRLGLRLVKGLSRDGAERLQQTRRQGPFTSIAALRKRAVLQRRDMQALADADALLGLGGNRHQSRWQVLADDNTTTLPQWTIADTPVTLPEPDPVTEMISDYHSTGLSLRAHPLQHLRPALSPHVLSAAALRRCPHKSHASIAGLVINRQRPGSAKGVIFMTLEDETGHVNVVIHQHLLERMRQTVLQAGILGVHGTVEREGDVLNLVATHLQDLGYLLSQLQIRSRDFR